MLEIFLQILSIIGIILLALIALIIVSILLALFFPVSYRIYGSKNAQKLTITGKAKWLFGLLRANYRYPEPGKLVVRFLWFTLYDSQNGASSSHNIPSTAADSSDFAESRDDSNAATASAEENISETRTEENTQDNPENQKDHESRGKFFQKVEKIKYTIHKIYDKIKEIWENISYYINLLQEEDTKQLCRHAGFRLGKILKNIRPRHMKVNFVFGTGSPDTTGYLYGAYCMLSPALGTGFSVTPDFERTVLEAEFDVSGRITLWVLSINAVKLILDKKLKPFIRKLKTGKGKKA